MINIETDNWYDAWVAINKRYATQPDLTINQRFATRAVSFDNDVEIASNDLAGLDPSIVGYTSYKMKLFDRNYIIPGLKEEIGDKLVQRFDAGKKLTVISYPFNINNKAHDQGPCVINITITAYKVKDKAYARFRVNMRVGEVTKRLLVDFIKFQQLIEYWLDRLKAHNVELERIEFNSPVLYAQPLFMIICESHPDLAFKFDKPNWFHEAVNRQHEKFENPNFAFKMGKRVRNHVAKLRAKN